MVASQMTPEQKSAAAERVLQTPEIQDLIKRSGVPVSTIPAFNSELRRSVGNWLAQNQDVRAGVAEWLLYKVKTQEDSLKKEHQALSHDPKVSQDLVQQKANEYVRVMQIRKDLEKKLDEYNSAPAAPAGPTAEEILGTPKPTTVDYHFEPDVVTLSQPERKAPEKKAAKVEIKQDGLSRLEADVQKKYGTVLSGEGMNAKDLVRDAIAYATGGHIEGPLQYISAVKKMGTELNKIASENGYNASQLTVAIRKMGPDEIAGLTPGLREHFATAPEQKSALGGGVIAETPKAKSVETKTEERAGTTVVAAAPQQAFVYNIRFPDMETINMTPAERAKKEPAYQISSAKPLNAVSFANALEEERRKYDSVLHDSKATIAQKQDVESKIRADLAAQGFNLTTIQDTNGRPVELGLSALVRQASYPGDPLGMSADVTSVVPKAQPKKKA